MKNLFAVLALAVAALAGPAHATTQSAAPNTAGSCDAQATEKKLSGAAKTSFLKKCNADSMASSASATCDSQAAAKKLSGAAKTSFLKKCNTDAAAPAAAPAVAAAPAASAAKK